MKPFNLTDAIKGKEVQTKAGRPVNLIYYARNIPNYPLVGLVFDDDGLEILEQYTAEGLQRVGTTSENDLVMVDETKTIWINIYSSGSIISFNDKESADNFVNPYECAGYKVDCLEYTYTI